MKYTDEIRVPLSIFNEKEISFTYPDSMLHPFLDKDGPSYNPEYHGVVFTLREIEQLMLKMNLSVDGWSPDLTPQNTHYVEMQAWNQAVLDVNQDD